MVVLLFFHLCRYRSVLLIQQSYFALLPEVLTLNDSDVDPMEVVDMTTKWGMEFILASLTIDIYICVGYVNCLISICL